MPDILIRGLSKQTVERIDATAKDLRLSRSAYIRRVLAGTPEAPSRRRATTMADLRRLTEAIKDMDDSEVMKGAWECTNG